MSVQMVLLPVFIQVALTFALLIWMALARRETLVSGETKIRDIALGEPNWPKRATQIANCFANQFELPVLFYVLIALALPLRHADLFIVLTSENSTSGTQVKSPNSPAPPCCITPPFTTSKAGCWMVVGPTVVNWL